MYISGLIKDKLRKWANSRTLRLQENGNYTTNLNDNLFKELTDDSRKEFEKGNGNEITAKMQALHSSSALVVNVFEYWKSKKEYSKIANILKLKTENLKQITYEEKFPILRTVNIYPNLDICFKYGDGSIVAVEGKFIEPFGSHEKEIPDEYLKDGNIHIWSNLENLLNLAKNLKKENFCFIDAKQLILHILGLQNTIKDKNKYQLAYLYYAVSDIDKNAEKEHRNEIEKFQKIVAKDDINFKSMIWQDIIKSLRDDCADTDKDYIDYITNRYL
ncbi:MAG: hypothetical protein LBV16_08185 [Elusimicrobiota bacterium]|jgi:hypothetical protein|nr:hypothetical protein [Elusimicrobiota bacterium]